MDALGIIRQMQDDPALRAQLRSLLLTEEVLGLPALVAENSHQIAELRAAVTESSHQIAELRAAVTENSHQIAELRADVSENSRQIAGLQTAVSELRAAVTENSRQIAELRADVSENSRQIAELRADVSENSRQIAELQTAVSELRAAVSENSRQIAQLQTAVSELRAAVSELRVAVSGLESAFAKLQGAFADLRTEVGRLSAIVGGTVEEDAASLVRTVLERQGVRLDSDPEAVELNGEIDVVARGIDETGAPITALVEAKTRLRPADVRRFAASYPALVARLGVKGAHLGYVYGFRVYSGSDDAARQAGLGVLSPDGERVAPVGSKT